MFGMRYIFFLGIVNMKKGRLRLSTDLSKASSSFQLIGSIDERDFTLCSVREECHLVLNLCCAGVGTRHYYRKLGYQLEGPYMTKMLPTYFDDCDW